MNPYIKSDEEWFGSLSGEAEAFQWDKTSIQFDYDWDHDAFDPERSEREAYEAGLAKVVQQQKEEYWKGKAEWLWERLKQGEPVGAYPKEYEVLLNYQNQYTGADEELGVHFLDGEYWKHLRSPFRESMMPVRGDFSKLKKAMKPLPVEVEGKGFLMLEILGVLAGAGVFLLYRFLTGQHPNMGNDTVLLLGMLSQVLMFLFVWWMVPLGIYCAYKIICWPSSAAKRLKREQKKVNAENADRVAVLKRILQEHAEGIYRSIRFIELWADHEGMQTPKELLDIRKELDEFVAYYGEVAKEWDHEVVRPRGSKAARQSCRKARGKG